MKRYVEFADSSRDVPVRGFLHRPETAHPAGLVLTHGAGSNCRSTLLMVLAEAFCAAGWLVFRCDLPFRQAKPKGPPPRGAAETDQAGLRAAVNSMRRETNGLIYLGGHSYGGRQASMVAATEPDLADALLLLSYPLHPPERPDVMRTSHWPDLRTPALFVHGTRDGFGSIAEMNHALQLIPGRAELVTIPNAGHELIATGNRRHIADLIKSTFLKFVVA